jgi:hypothetical protein
MQSGFTDGAFAYSSKNSCDTTMYYDPNCSYGITYQAWGGTDWYAPSGGLNTSGYTALTYNLYPNGQPLTDFGALFTNTSGNLIKEIPLSSSMVTQLSGGWYHVSVPVSQLNPSNVAVGEIQLKNEMNASLATVHYDDVMLTGTAPTATPVPPTATAVLPTATSTSTSIPAATNTPAPTSTPTKHHGKP